MIIKHHSRIIASIIVLAFTTVSSAQEAKIVSTKSKFGNDYKIRQSENGWIYFDRQDKVKEAISDLFEDRRAIGLEESDKFKVKGGSELVEYLSQKTDWTDDKPIRTTQYHNGLRVSPSGLQIHYDTEGNIKLIQGQLVRRLPNAIPGITEFMSLDLALAACGAEEYAWQNAEKERELRDDPISPNTTYFPKGELIYYQVPGGVDFKLGWSFSIVVSSPIAEQIEVFVDATTGQAHKSSLSRSSNGTVVTINAYGNRVFQTEWRVWPFSDWRLRWGDKVHTKRYNVSDWWPNGENPVDSDDNVWNAAQSPDATAHWATQMAWEYFGNAFLRNGPTGDGQLIRIRSSSTSVQSLMSEIDNYHYITVGTANGVAGGQAKLDIIGHEMTHIINACEGDLKYYGEPGALDESFGDIFGIMVKYSILGSLSWKIMEHSATAVRDMADPNSEDDPDTYGQTGFWKNANCTPTVDNDYCGKHSNNGVQNYWFYLLVNGGSSTNGIGQNYAVTGIGLTNAAKIAYRNLANYVFHETNFAGAREGSLNAAYDLFGPCSQQYISTMNAWHAVGVGSAFSGVCASQIAFPNQTLCIEDNPYGMAFSVQVFPLNATVTWYAPANWNKTVNGTTLILNSINSPVVGTQTLSLSVSSGGSTTWRYYYLNLIQCCNSPNCQQNLTISQEVEDNVELSLSPNPAKEVLNIRILPRRSSYVIRIVDSLGRDQFQAVTESESVLDISCLSPGVYFLVVAEDTSTRAERFIVK